MNETCLDLPKGTVRGTRKFYKQFGIGAVMHPSRWLLEPQSRHHREFLAGGRQGLKCPIAHHSSYSCYCSGFAYQGREYAYDFKGFVERNGLGSRGRRFLTELMFTYIGEYGRARRMRGGCKGDGKKECYCEIFRNPREINAAPRTLEWAVRSGTRVVPSFLGL